MEYYERFNKTIQSVFGEEMHSDLSVAETGAPTLSSTPDPMYMKQASLDESFVRLGDTYVHLRKYQDALDCYREALKINHRNVTAFNRLLVIPPYLMKPLDWSEGAQPAQDFQQLALNDTFRQTLIGGYVVLSKSMMQLDSKILSHLFWAIQNLGNDYFEKHGGPLRDHGVIVLNRVSYVWMINHCQYHTEDNCQEFPVLLLMKRGEYHQLKKMIG